MATTVEVTPLALGLIAGLLTITNTVVSVALTRIFSVRSRVAVKDFTAYRTELERHRERDWMELRKARKQSWEEHYKFCPENRKVLTMEQHEKDCAKNLKPLSDDIAEIKEAVKHIVLVQTKTITQDNMKDLVETIMVAIRQSQQKPHQPTGDNN